MQSWLKFLSGRTPNPQLDPNQTTQSISGTNPADSIAPVTPSTRQTLEFRADSIAKQPSIQPGTASRRTPLGLPESKALEHTQRHAAASEGHPAVERTTKPTYQGTRDQPAPVFNRPTDRSCATHSTPHRDSRPTTLDLTHALAPTLRQTEVEEASTSADLTRKRNIDQLVPTAEATLGPIDLNQTDLDRPTSTGPATDDFVPDAANAPAKDDCSLVPAKRARLENDPPAPSPAEGSAGPSRTQPHPHTHMDPTTPPTTFKPGNVETVRFRFENALRPQFWLMMLWAVAGYRENPKYLDPQDPSYSDKRNRINSLLHEIFSDPHLQNSANSFSYLRFYLPAYRTHCFENTNVSSLNETIDQISTQQNIPPVFRWLNRSDPNYTDPDVRHTLINYWASAERLFNKFINPPPKFPGVRDTKPNRNPNIPNPGNIPPPPPRPTTQDPLPVTSPPVTPPVNSRTLRPPPGFNPLPNPPANPLPNPPANPLPNPPANPLPNPPPNPFPTPPPNPPIHSKPQSDPTNNTNFPVSTNFPVNTNFPVSPNPSPTQFPPMPPPPQDPPMISSVPLSTAVPISPSVQQTFLPGSPFYPVQFGNILLPYTLANFAVPPATIIPIQAGQVARTVNPPSTSYPAVRPVWLHEIHRFDYTHNLVTVTRETNATDNGDLLSVTQIIPLELYYTSYRPDPLALVTRVTVQPPAGRPYLPP